MFVWEALHAPSFSRQSGILWKIPNLTNTFCSPLSWPDKSLTLDVGFVKNRHTQGLVTLLVVMQDDEATLCPFNVFLLSKRAGDSQPWPLRCLLYIAKENSRVEASLL